jgi:ABC-2 type transport system permease protein
MNRLLGMELRRFFARRLTRLLALAMLLGVVAAGIGLAVNSDRDVAGAQAAARAKLAAAVAQNQAARAECVADPPGGDASQCGPAIQASEYPPGAFYSDPRFSFHDHVRELVRTGVYLSALLTLLAAASFVGAEWQAGTFASLLTCEPRRLRVYLAKLAAAVAGSVAIAVVAIAAFVGVAALVAATRGTFATTIPPEREVPPVHHLAGLTLALGARGLGLVAVTAAIAATLATLMRHTVAAVGAVLAYFVIGEGIIGSLRQGDVRHHLLSSYVRAVVDGTYSWLIRIVGPDGSVSFDSRHVRTLHALSSGLLLAGLVVLLIVGTAVVLQRRDVA